MRTCKHHNLLLEILDVCTFGEELGHIAYLMACLAREDVASARENSSSDEHRHVWQIGNQFLHESQILCTIIFCRHMDLQERDVDIAKIIMIPLCRVADEQFTLWIVVLQPILQGSAYEATSDNSNVDHFLSNFEILLFVINYYPYK